MFCLVREFLEFFNLDFTISVYEPESYLGTAYDYEGRHKIIKELGLSQLEEHSPLPLLLQLIKLVQIKQDSNSNGKENHKNVKTSEEIVVETVQKRPKKVLNETFDISNGSISKEHNKSGLNHKEETTDDITAATDDISKDYLLDLDKSVKSVADNSQVDTEKTRNLVDQSLTEQEKSIPSVKDLKFGSKFEATMDKIKLSPQKTDKLKAKSNLSSLSDLPPLPLNKSRDTMVLPSLYNKEFKDKKDLDKFLDVDTFDNYEEDFMSSGELELGLTKINLPNSESEHQNFGSLLKPKAVYKKSNGLSDNCEGLNNKTDSSVSEELNPDDPSLTSSASK